MVTQDDGALLGQVDVMIAHQLELSAGNRFAHDLVVLNMAGIHHALDHGVDDFNVSQKYNVPITVPVDDGGCLTELAGKYAGQRVWAANKTILADLRS